MIVSNTSPLMYLAKLGKLEFLQKLFGKVFIPQAVYTEVVVRGKERGFADAILIEKAIDNRWMEVKKAVADRKIEKYISELDSGEAEVIKLAITLKPSLVLIDDAPARAIAQGLGLFVKGTLYVLLKANAKKLIDKNECKKLLSRMISLGFRISPELYGKILEELEKF